MHNDKKKLYAISSLFFILPFALLFVPLDSRITAAVLLSAGAILTALVIKKRSVPSFNKGQALLVVSVFALFYVALTYLSGLYFGFYKSDYTFGIGTLLYYVLPISVIIVTSEMIRNILLAQEDKAADVFCYLGAVVCEALIYYNFKDINTYFKFMDFLGMAILPAFISGGVYHFIAKRFGMYPNIAYRLITTLYAYVIPVTPAMPDSLVSFVGLFIPLVLYGFISLLFVRKRRYAAKRKSKLLPIVSAVLLVLIVSLVMLISCKFRYGALVIATESMTGEINRGDAVVYEQYDRQIINEGEVIVFERYGSLVVHRVVKIERINGSNRYYTKGDANEDNDTGYISDGNIVGVVELKLPYVGYPTVWLNNLFP